MASSMVATTMLSASFVSASAVESNSTLPESYSSVEKGYVTAVRHQGDTSTCWAHAAMAACESSMIIHNGYDTSLDLAELHLAYSAYHANKDKMGMFDGTQRDHANNYIMAGSHAENALISLANQQGVVTEDANHGQFSSKKLLMHNPANFGIFNSEALYSYNEAVVKNAYKASAETNPELLKEYIIKYGAGTMEYLSDEKYFNKENNAQYCYDGHGATHAVAVVGWDDNYPKENFNVDGHIPNENGAWLIKNSYGTESYNDGYIWISYEDKTIGKHPSVFFELDEPNWYTNVYQYDDICLEKFLFTGENFIGNAYMANMFTSQKDNETLDAVSFYTSNEVLDYKIDIYTDVEGNTDPTNGTLKATVSGEALKMGYHTIELPSSVALEKGKQFSVVVNLIDKNNSESGIMVNVDSAQHMYLQQKVTQYGESFYSYNGESWDDLKNIENANMRIKAFTNSDTLPEVTPDYYNTYNGKTRDQLYKDFGETLNKCDAIFNYDYDIQPNTNYFMLLSAYTYAKDAYDNPDIFLALEFCELNNLLNERIKYLNNYSTEEYIMYHETHDCWNEYTSCYKEILDEAKDDMLVLPLMTEYSNKIETKYNKFINIAILEGALDSYLQLFGDTDNNSEVNISDATEIQKILADYKDFNFYSYYNSDVTGDGLIDIRDVTEIQKFLADRAEYFPVYDKQFGDEEVNTNIDADQAVANLSDAVSKVKESNVLDSGSNNEQYLLLNNLYNNACTVLEDSQSYYPNVIDFKARNLNFTLQNYLDSQA